MTFNDMPKVLCEVLNKIERLKKVLDGIKDEITCDYADDPHTFDDLYEGILEN